MTDCSQLDLGFHPRLPVQVVFDAPETSSDGGALLLRQMDDRLKLCERFAFCVPDFRDPRFVVHERLEQSRQRIFQIALGYEDCNDAGALRHDPLLKVACDLMPEDEGTLSSQPTLSRLENAADMRAIKKLLLQLEGDYVASFTTPPELVVLDIDTTDDPTHGQQQLTFFHGFYDQHMYHPMMVFDAATGQLVTAVLRPGNAHAARGGMGVLQRIIVALKRRFPTTSIVVRGDSGFAMPRLMAMIEALNAELGEIYYLFGLAQNAVLRRLGEPVMAAANAKFAAGHDYVRHFDSFRYAAETWPHERLVVMKAERSEKGENPRFIVTSIEGFPPAWMYDAYCERGQCENFIKDFKNALQADRLSCHTFTANFFRLLEHAAAYVLMHALRLEAGKQAPALATVQMDTLRLRLLKVAATVKQSSRRILVRLPKAFPLASVFAAISTALVALNL
jgi:hypothetical protein